MAALLQHNWPGNVRELIHALEQAVALCDGDVVQLEDLPASVRSGGSTLGSTQTDETPTLREVQRRHILSVLEKTGGNRAQAAGLLGTSERTFYRLLQKFSRPSAAPRRRGDVPPPTPGS